MFSAMSTNKFGFYINDRIFFASFVFFFICVEEDLVTTFMR